MADRVPSDHPSVTTVRATLDDRGATGRPVVTVPTDAGADLEPGVVRCTLDGTERFARVERPLTGEGLEVRRVADSPEGARTGEGPSRLVEWVEDADVRVGGTVHLDVVEPEFKYGLRAPGERSVYDATEAPDDDLAAIAEDLEDRD